MQTIVPLCQLSGVSAAFHAWSHILVIHETIYLPPVFIISAVMLSVPGDLWFFMPLISPCTSASVKSLTYIGRGSAGFQYLLDQSSALGGLGLLGGALPILWACPHLSIAISPFWIWLHLILLLCWLLFFWQLGILFTCHCEQQLLWLYQLVFPARHIYPSMHCTSPACLCPCTPGKELISSVHQ